MSDQEFEGAVNTATGTIDTAVHAKAERAKAVIGDVAEKLTAGISDAGDQASAAVSKLGDQAIGVYDRASVAAQKMGETIEPLVKERPYAALGIAAFVGAVAGLLLAGRGPKVIYVRPPH